MKEFEFREQDSLWEPIDKNIFISELERTNENNLRLINNPPIEESTISKISSGKIDDSGGPYLEYYSLVELKNKYGRTYRWINIDPLFPDKDGVYIARAYLVRGGNKSPIVYQEIERYVPFFNKEGKFLGKLIIE